MNAALLLSLALASSDPRLLVLEAKATEVPETEVTAIERLVLQGLDDAVARGAEVIAVSDLARLLELEGQRQLTGCDDQGCLAEVAAAMGADLVVTLELGRLGSSYVLQMTLFDDGGARVRGRETVRGASVEDLSTEVPRAARALLLPLAADNRVSLADVQAEAPPPAGPSGLLVAGGVTAALGGALLLGGGAGLGASALVVGDRSIDAATRRGWQDSRWWWLGAAGIGAAAVVAGGGLAVVGALE